MFYEPWGEGRRIRGSHVEGQMHPVPIGSGGEAPNWAQISFATPESVRRDDPTRVLDPSKYHVPAYDPIYGDPYFQAGDPRRIPTPPADAPYYIWGTQGKAEETTRDKWLQSYKTIFDRLDRQAR
jgi:hypothetical protein